MESWESGTGQNVWVHDPHICKGQYCCIHNPSDHHMREWPLHWRDDRGLMERICKCGTGHPDPDDLAFKLRLFGEKFMATEGVHGCCGCCLGPGIRISKNPDYRPPILRDGDTGKKCPKCGSSQSSRWTWFRRIKYCIHPDCENYIIRQIYKE